ncbi:MAG: hypothetical protein GY715_10855, partial [Planctomycetes bacterium]|nr:hypothetical protein [Planctomycetota bacterium]
RVTMRAGAGGETPVLSDLRIALRDPDPAVPAVQVANATAFESDSGSVPLLLTVTLSSPAAAGVTVDYQTVEASATAGIDYTPTSGTLTFATGSSSRTVTVNVLGDSDEEDAEFFFLRLSNPQGAVIADASGTATIVDDDLRAGPVAGTEVTYTLDEDFDRGRSFNVHHDVPLGDQ